MKTTLSAMLTMLLVASTQAQDLRQTPHELRREVSRTVELNYLLYLPPGFQEGTNEWPLLLFLHGAGERGSDLERCGGDVRLTVYPEAGHDSWTETYDNPELYEWFLQHRRER